MNAKLLSGTGLALAVVLFLAINIISNTRFTTARIDFTEDGLYTLSPGTINIITALDEPVTLRFYLSRKLAGQLPGLSSYATRVEELLREYEINAGGNLKLLVIDPEPFSEEEDRAVGYGIRGLALAELQETLYFGLVGTNSVGEQRVVPYFNQIREQFLEYDVTRLIQQLSQNARPVVGLLSTIPINGVNADQLKTGALPQTLTLVDQIRETFMLRSLSPRLSEIEEDVDLLMLIHPRRLPEETQYAIDQFVLRGGRVLALVDPYAEADARQSAAGIPEVTSTDFNRVLSSWGIELEADTVVTDLEFGTRVQTQQNGKVVAFDYPVWITYPAALLNPFDTVTADLDNLTLASAGHLKILPDSGLSVEPLVQSSAEADRVTLEQISFTADPQELLRNYEGEKQQFPIMVRVTGEARSAFSEPPTVADDDAAPQAPHANHLNESETPVNIIVLADTDMLQDRYWVQAQEFLGSRIALPFAGNGSLIVNALDNLSGSEDLISVRSRGTFSRPFERVTQIRRDAELQYRQKEQELIERLEQTERELLALENQKAGDDALILSEVQQQRLREFQSERLTIRKSLRDVRHELHKDIETLEATLKFINIGLVPLLIGFGGLLAAGWKLRRRRDSHSAAAGPSHAKAQA